MPAVPHPHVWLHGLMVRHPEVQVQAGPSSTHQAELLSSLTTGYKVAQPLSLP